jgi:hypothetical protein
MCTTLERVMDRAPSYAGDDLTCLIGQEINCIAFVMDYVEIHFNGPILRALTDPMITVAGARFAFPEPGSRDALCTLIGQQVESIRVDHDRIDLTTRNATLLIPLDEQSRAGPEAAHFVPASPGGTLRVEAMLIW